MIYKEILTTEDAADYLGVSSRTLAKWRAEGKSPKYYKPSSKLIYYFVEDLAAWVKETGGAGND